MKVFVLSCLSLILSLGSLKSQENWPQPDARLRAYIDKQELVLGEAFTLTVTYEVSDNNKVPIQFIEAGWHVYQMIKKLDSLGFSADSEIENIYGRRVYGKDSIAATTYDVLKMKIWPRQPGSFEVPALEMPFETYKNHYNADSSEVIRKDTSIINPKTQPIPYQVTANQQWNSDQDFPLIGDLTIKSNVSAGPHRVGEVIDCEISILGPASIIFAQPVFKESKQIEVSVDFIDFGISNKEKDLHLYEKKFKLSLMPKVHGDFALSDLIQWQFQKSAGDEMATLAPSTKLAFLQGDSSGTLIQRNFFLAMDISESMQLEDYNPNRLGIAKKIAETYTYVLPSQYITAFSGDFVNLAGMDPFDVSPGLAQNRGTAIGNTLWLGTEMLMNSPGEKVIIILGDGDNTAGVIDVPDAIKFANDHGIRVFTVGIGHIGRQPFGKDFYGRPNFVDNTFIDASLKKIAAETDGQYFYVDDFQNPREIIKAIIKELEKN